MSQRVLITGAAGLLGSSLAAALRLHGHPVATSGRSETNQIRGDLTVAADAERIIAASAPQIVINLVAYTDVDGCQADPRRAYRENVRTLENLVGAIAACPSRPYLVHIGSDQVYDGSGPHRESEVCPINTYAYAKLLADSVAERAGGTVLRTNFIGPGATATRSSFAEGIRTALRSGRPITAFTDVWFSPLTTGTLCGLIGEVCRRRIPGIFNVGSRDGLSKRDVIHSLARAWGLPTAGISDGLVAAAHLRAPRPTDMRMDVSRFEAAYGVRLPLLADEINAIARQGDRT